MKATMRFLTAMIVAVGLCSLVSAQTTDATKTGKVAKPIGARIYNQADLDSLGAKLSRMNAGETVTVEVLMEVMQYFHDATLRDGHKEYVSMPGFFKKQVTKKFDSRLSRLSDDVRVAVVKVDTTAANLATVGDEVNDVAYFVRGLDQTVANIELIVTADETPIIPPQELGVMTGFDGSRASMPANKVAMELIRKNVAARRAAAAATMTPFR